MVEFFVAGLVLLILFSVIAAVVGVLSFVFWVLMLPFRLLGMLLHGLGWLLVLPFLLPVLLVGLLMACVAFAVAIPALPIILVVLAIAALMRRRGAPRTA